MVEPKEGDQKINQDGAYWRIACGVHLGESPISQETRIDHQTGNPRECVQDIDGELVRVVVEFPVYGECVGYQADCPVCMKTLLDTRLHIMAVEGDKMQADYEFELDRARREGLK